MSITTLEKLKTAVTNAVTDLTTVDVSTFTGTLEIDLGTNNAKMSPKKIFDTLKGSPKGKLQLLAHTHKDFDADTLQFVKENLNEEGGALLLAHQQAVEAADEQRAAAIEILRSLL